MTTIIVPPIEASPYPTLGPYICEFIEERLVHGPGDLLGEPVALDDEAQAWIYRMYEVEPEYGFTVSGRRSKKRNRRAGRRRFDRCVLSLRKGSNKTEFAAWLAAVELHPEGPVRCAGFDEGGQPIPMAVTDPYIPMIAYTEEQSEELAYGALRRILEESPIARDFDIGLERIMRIGGDGKAEAVSGSPNARDGARTTFQHADETHRFTLDHLRQAWMVMLANLAKRPLADPWALETTTAPEPGSGSVAETTMDYALKHRRRQHNGRFFFFHREASDQHDLTKKRGLRAAILEASGPHIAKWTDVERVMRQFDEDDADRAYLERVWLNRRVQAAAKAFDVTVWAHLARFGYSVDDR
ncbi:MAG: terminase, partial [Acidimicrobiia bacterium]